MNFKFNPIIFAFFMFICEILAAERSFIINYENDEFQKDGHPFRYISGTVHYFRIPADLWEDRLIRLRSMGANAVETYIMWNLHESRQGHYNIDGNLNFTEFVLTAHRLDMVVILRIGPFADAEQDLGGLPAWLLKRDNVQMRSFQDKKYLSAVKSWYDVLLPLVKPLLYQLGGPIVMIQIENEYGSYGADMEYKLWLKNLTESHLGSENVVYFTTDGNSVGYLKGGVIPGVYPTVDFGPSEKSIDVEKSFKAQRVYAPKGPLVNSEFYTGWFSYWGAHHPENRERTISNILITMEKMYQMNASFNFYTSIGATNWGYQAGAEYYDKYVSVTTSYDFRAPISEHGGLTPKYFAVRQAIERLTGKPSKYLVPPQVQLFWYGEIHLKYLGNIFDFLDIISPESQRVSSRLPKTAEDIGHYGGFILYETVVPFGGGMLSCESIRDRGYIFQDGKMLQMYQRTKDENKTLPVPLLKGSRLQILVENQGRICYGKWINTDRKGIVGNLTLDDRVLENWTIYPLDLENVYHAAKSKLHKLVKPRGKTNKIPNNTDDNFIPSFFYGTKDLTPEIGDTYFDPDGWGKGQLILNGINFGKYWPNEGPQITLYAPKPYLKKRTAVMMFELDKPNCNAEICSAKFINYRREKP